MAQEFGTRRPSGVTIVAVLVWLGAVFDILAGLLLLIVPQDPALVEGMGGTALVVTFGIISILLASCRRSSASACGRAIPSRASP